MKILLAIVIIIVFCIFIYITVNKSKIIGVWGEMKVSFVLSMLGRKYRVFNNVLIKNSLGTSQIDHLVVSPYGIFVIETKNYKGWITGGVNSDKWTQILWKNRYELANPIRQNYGHIKALQSVLPLYCPEQYISIIAFSHKAKLKVRVEDSYNVVHYWNVIFRIYRYRKKVLTEEQQKAFIAALRPFLNAKKADTNNHIASVKQNKSRREFLIQSGICPQCGGAIVRRDGMYGYFYGCSNYPNCKFTTKNITR